MQSPETIKQGTEAVRVLAPLFAAGFAIQQLTELVDHARARLYQKRSGNVETVSLSVVEVPAAGPAVDVIALDHALDRLAAADERKARVIELRFFGGMSVEETADVLHVSGDTVKRDWRLAKLWLARELEGPRA